MTARTRRLAMRRQRGMFLIEALIAILIFSLGILGMIAMGGAAVSATSDAQYRTEAASHADAIVGEIQVRANRTGDDADLAASLDAFRHHETTVADCNFTGVDALDTRVLALVNRAGSDLPDAPSTRQQIRVENGPNQYNRITVTLCWKSGSDGAARQHTMVTYVN